MGAAHTALAWASSILAMGFPVVVILAIKWQELRDRQYGGADDGLVDGVLYLRRYRFLWAVLPMALFLFILVGVPMLVGRVGGPVSDTAENFLLSSIVIGLLAWALTISLIYNRYFHSAAERPFRLVSGAERALLRASRSFAFVSVVLMTVGLAQ